MRRSSDLSVDRPRRRISGRGILIALGGLFLFILIFGRAIARFYVDYLWYDALGRSDVFWGVLSAQVTLFALFFVAFAVIAGLNLYLADRAAPTQFPANVHPYVERFHELFGKRLRLVRYGIALLFAVLLALPAVALWQDWMLFRNATEFGVSDPQFNIDVGFYVFQLPFLSFMLNWLFAALIVVLLLTAAAHILNGGVVFVSPVPAIRQATKAHLAVLLAVLAVVKAGDYWLDRYDVTNSQTGIVQGATYSVVNAQLPAIMLLILIALLTAGLYLSVVRTGSFRMPLIASALWLVVALVGGVIYPAVVQALVVNPNQQEREQEFIARNVDATKQALGLTEVVVEDVEFESLNAAEVEADLAPLDNVRLLNPAQMVNRFKVDRGEVAGLTIDDLDVDRYVLDDSIDNQPEEVLIAARELQLSGVTNTSWQGLHLINTRGCGLVLAPTGRVLESQRPDYRTVELERPELYFSPSLTGYAIANTSSTERECSEPHQYEGTSGVAMSSLARRAAFALAFLDYNVIGFGGIQDDSQMLWVRGINDRLEKLAPFLSYDADPYPVDLNGRVVWVTDAYTTTSRYPYAQRIGDVQRSPQSGLSDDDNYVRNSVKAVTDAYTGDVTFYVVDEEDPILRSWRGAFPDLFTPLSEMPEELRDNLRFPEDLFRIQTDVWSKYRIAADQFFQRVGAWSVAQAPGIEPSQAAAANPGAAATGAAPTAAQSTFADESDTGRFVPYYTMFDTSAPGEPATEEFVILRPFVPFSTNDQRTELQAFMTASSEPENYGQLTSYIVQETNNRLPDGPLRVASNAESTELISRRISLDNVGGGGSEVRFGDLQLIPVSQGLVYVRPYYVAVPQNSAEVTSVTEYRGVIVSYNDQAVLEDTVSEALAELFPGFEGDIAETIEEPSEPTDDPETTDPPDPVDPETDTDPDSDVGVSNGDDPLALLQQADEAFAEADEALADGDLGLYQDKIREARALITDAFELIERP